MTPIFNPLAAQTAMLRMAGYAASQQLAVMQTFTRFATNMPALQARAVSIAFRGGEIPAEPAPKPRTARTAPVVKPGTKPAPRRRRRAPSKPPQMPGDGK